MGSWKNVLSTAISSLLSSGNSINNGATFTLSCAGGSVTFPVSPSSFDMDNPYKNGTVVVNALGEIGMLGKRRLATLTVNSFFPAQEYGFEQSAPDGDPYTYIDTLKQFAEAGQPCKLAISGTSISVDCTIESLRYGEHDGTGDVYFTLALREYRYIQPAATDATNDATGLKSRVAETTKEKDITVFPGDSVMDVAARSVGQFTSITKQQANKLALFKKIATSSHLSVGSVLQATKTKVKVGDTTIHL